MQRTATRTSSIFTRIDPETKSQAEMILDKLGIPLSNAICMFLKQIVLQNGIPFEMKLPPDQVPVSYGSLTREQFDIEMRKGLDDIAAGRVHSAESVESEIKGMIDHENNSYLH